MTEQHKYFDEEKKEYILTLKEINDKEMSFTIIGKTETNEIYSSTYYVDNLNEKFGKIKNFKKIKEFQQILTQNIEKETLKLKSPYRNVISSEWLTFPKDKTKKDTFTLISSRSLNKNISLLFYSNYTQSEYILKELEKQLSIKIKAKKDEQIYSIVTLEDNPILDGMYFLKGKYENEEKKLKDYLKIIETNKQNLEYRTLLILFDEDNMIDSLMEIIKNYYKDQLFVIIFTKNDKRKLKLEIELRIMKLSETKRSYFDFSNIFVYEDSDNGAKNTVFPILRVYSYFNQLGDGFYKQLSDFKINIKNQNINEELKYLNYTHYFNKLLCGMTGTGKSTFINKIMGKKKTFTLKSKSAGTYRNNFYVHKNYPIKIIDICGFADGREGKENLEGLYLIYKKDIPN